MSSFYQDASLVMIPSGYKTGKVYSAVPTDGTGDLVFTRSNDTATRVNSAGLIEKVRTNVVSYSQDFSDASWTKTALTISTSATANPVNGALTAQDAIPTAVSSVHRVFKLAGVVSTANTWSIFAKAKGYNFITIVENGNTSASVSFNLSTGAVSTQISAVGQIQSLGNGWYRCSMIHTTATTPRFDVFVSPTDSQAAYTGDGTSGVTLFGAQAEASDFGATDYIPTTTAAASVGPVANVPRLDYLNSTCPKLILEPQRINLQLNSEDFSQANWSKTNTTIVVNQLASPDGYLNADKLNETAVNNIHQLESSRSVSASTVYTMSVFAKKAERSFVRIYEDTTFNSAYFNLDSGTIGTISGPTATAKIENYGNGWYRCSVTYTETGTFGRYRITIAKQDNEASYLGVAGSGIYVWGAQYEAGAYATSYIPTLGASVTRVADAASKTGISSLIGQTEGTLFLDFESGANDSIDYAFTLNDGTTTNRMRISRGAGNTITAQIRVAAVTQALIQTATVTPNTRFKCALAYKLNDVALYVNGAEIGVDTSSTIPACSVLATNLGDGTGLFGRPINQALLFTTRLTNNALASLTTL